ncbi:MAG TPA: ADOP family duplicated permease [Vicinamibacterales bacterium]|nr:ADOP family duplicated permease [Vicinamibacterales bacterium]
MADLDRALYRLLLRLYPAEFRRQHAAELEAIYEWCVSVERQRRGPLLARIRGFGDAVRGAWALRRRTHRRRASFMSTLAQDLRFALRSFRRQPMFIAGLVLVLALGIGANGAIFSLVKAVLLDPLPYRDPDRLAMVYRTMAPRHEFKSYGMTREWLYALHGEAADVMQTAGMKMWRGNLDAQLDLELDDRAERLRGTFVTSNFFQVVGVEAALGRVFTPADESAGPTLVVVSDAFWRRALGGRTSAIGETITVAAGRRPRAARQLTIIGVLAPDVRFTYPLATEIWALESWTEVQREPGGAILFEFVSRLNPGVSVETAEARLAALTESMERRGLTRGGDRFRLQPVDEWVAGAVRPTVVLLAGVAGLLLVIACVTVGNALLVRLGERQRELAVRASLGAGRTRLARQLVTEGLVLAAAGTIAGCTLASLLLPIFRSLVPATVPRADEMQVDVWMLAFAAGAAIVVTVLSTLAPAWQTSRVDLVTAIKRASGPASSARATLRWRGVLVAVQGALAACLLTGAALLLASFWRLSGVALGYDADDVVTVEMRLLDAKYSIPGAIGLFERDIVSRLRAIPGVEDVGMGTAVPFRGVDFSGSYDPPGCEHRPPDPAPPDCRSVGGHNRHVDNGFFRVMRIGLVRGRLFDASDAPTSPRVAVVSQSFARAMFGDVDPIGRSFEGYQVVGVVADVRFQSLQSEAAPAVYFPRSQQPSALIAVVIRASPGTAITAASVHAAIRAVDPAVPAMDITTIGQIRSASIADRRFYTTTTVAFAALALLLTAAGLVIVVARSVVERRREIAIRTALGARGGQLVTLLVRQGLTPVVAGVAVGLGAAWIGARWLQQFLFEVDRHAAFAYALPAAVVLVVGAIACLWPARRITELAPAAVLRAE